MIMRFPLIVVCILIVSGLCEASEYNFGTKVNPGDVDIGRPVNDLFPFGVPATVAMWDIGQTPGFFDNQDVIYLVRFPVPATVPSDAVRLTSYDIYPAGSKVKSSDIDNAKPLIPIPTPNYIVFLDLYGTSGPAPSMAHYDLEDPVYWHQNTKPRTVTNDVRLSDIATFSSGPGSKIGNLDLDHNKALTIAEIWLTFPTASPSWLKYYDANGNFIYDYPDDVYLIRQIFKGPGAANQVTVNSLRLSGPAY
jgi:hypothetical protein